MSDGSERRTITNPKMWGSTVAISPDGRLLAVPSPPSSSPMLPIQIWDLAGDILQKELKFPEVDAKAHPAPYSMVSAVEFSPSGRFLAALRNDSIVVWDVEKGTVRSDATKANLPTVCGFCAGRDWLAYRTGIKEIKLWNLDLEEPPTVVEPPMLGMVHFALSSKAEFIASFGAMDSRSQSGSILFWNPWTKKQLGSIRLSAETLISSLSFSPDDKLLVAADNGGTIYVFDIATNSEWFRLPRAQKGMTRSFAWSADGSRSWSGGMDGSMRCWELLRDSPIGTVRLKTPQGGSSFALHPSSRQLAVGSTSSAGSVLLLNRDTGEVERELSPGNKPTSPTARGGWRVFYRGDGEQLALTSEKLAVVWDLATGKEVVAVGG